MQVVHGWDQAWEGYNKSNVGIKGHSSPAIVF